MIERAAPGGTFLIALGEQAVIREAGNDARRTAYEEVEQVTFPDGGGAFDLGLAINRLPDMDSVVVDEAALVLRALPHPIDVDAPSLEVRGDGSTLIDLGTPSRLAALDVTIGGTLDTLTQKVLLSAAEPDAAEAPMFAAPPFGASSDGLYPAPLTGMGSPATTGPSRMAFTPPVTGRRWSIRVVDAESPSELTKATSPTLTVTGVRVDASPTDLRATIPAGQGTDEAVLYAGAGPLLPAAEPQSILFTPLAQRHLQAGLDAAAPGAAMLTVPLRLTSASAGAIGIVSRSLRAHYVVELQEAPIERATGGAWADLPLVAPAHRRPRDGAGGVDARLAGHELDPASPLPPRLVPATGVTVAPRRLIAAQATASRGPSGRSTIVAIRMLLGADRPAEIVLEVRADAAGLPAATLATAVARIPATPPAWQEFLLPAPLDVAPPGRVWCVLRTNDQPVRWHTGTDGTVAVASGDDGATWATSTLPLGAGGGPLVQLFRPDSGEPPHVDLYHRERLVGGIDLGRTGAREATAPVTLPDPVLAALGEAPGDGRVPTILQLYSRTVMQLTIRGLACTYDPTG